MKRKITLGILFSALMIVGGFQYALTKSAGAPVGKSGSPGDGLNDCTDCHSGPALSSQTMTFQIDGADSIAYSPGVTYEIKVHMNNTVSVFNKAGFTIAAEDNASNNVGMFVSNSAVQVKNGTHATHTSSSNSVSGGDKTWTFDWTAPNSNVGDITFYIAGIFGNGDNDEGGDITIKTQQTIAFNQSSSVEELTNHIRLFPNPAVDKIYLLDAGKVLEYELYNMKGQRVAEGLSESNVDLHEISISSLEAGQYVGKFRMDGQLEFQRNILIID